LEGEMGEDSVEDLKKKVEKLEAQNKGLEDALREQLLVKDVLVAAGLVSRLKVDQAYDIVSRLTK
jgi:hypothetical protein